MLAPRTTIVRYHRDTTATRCHTLTALAGVPHRLGVLLSISVWVSIRMWLFDLFYDRDFVPHPVAIEKLLASLMALLLTIVHVTMMAPASKVKSLGAFNAFSGRGDFAHLTDESIKDEEDGSRSFLQKLRMCFTEKGVKEEEKNFSFCQKLLYPTWREVFREEARQLDENKKTAEANMETDQDYIKTVLGFMSY